MNSPSAPAIPSDAGQGPASWRHLAPLDEPSPWAEMSADCEQLLAQHPNAVTPIAPPPASAETTGSHPVASPGQAPLTAVPLQHAPPAHGFSVPPATSTAGDLHYHLD